MLLAAAGYAWLCSTSRKREWRVRGHTVHLPSGRMAALQFTVAATNWASIAGVLWVLMRGQVDYPSIVAVLLIAAIAGLVVHVPAGLGVIEGVFLALLSGRLPQGGLLAALLAYRAIYYLVPLAFAIPSFFMLDRRSATSESNAVKSVNPTVPTGGRPR